MAAYTDRSQLKNMGLFLAALGVVLVVVGYFLTGALWQVYIGIAVILLGAGLTAYAIKAG